MAATAEFRTDTTAKPGEVRNTTIQSRWGGSELALLDRLAGRLGLSRSATLRAAVDAVDAATDGRRHRDSPVTVRTVTTNDDQMALAMEVRLLGAEVRTVGRNVNQVAKGVNSGDAVEVKRVAELTAAVDHLRAMLDDLVHETKSLGIE